MGYRIVIADDEALIRMDIREMLEEAGHEIVGEAGNGADAVELVRRLQPDAAFFDVKMPVLDGIYAARQLAYDEISPILLLTAYSQQDVVERAKDAGVMGYLVKPVTQERLFPALEVAVSQFRHQKEIKARLKQLDEELETRKLVEKAKGYLMELYQIREEDAYERLRQYSMKKRMTMKATAQAVIQSVLKRKNQEAK